MSYKEMYVAVVQVFQQRGYKHHGSRLSCCRFFLLWN